MQQLIRNENCFFFLIEDENICFIRNSLKHKIAILLEICDILTEKIYSNQFKKVKVLNKLEKENDIFKKNVCLT